MQLMYYVYRWEGDPSCRARRAAPHQIAGDRPANRATRQSARALNTDQRSRITGPFRGELVDKSLRRLLDLCEWELVA
jgi:hypothetical protein